MIGTPRPPGPYMSVEECLALKEFAVGETQKRVVQIAFKYDTAREIANVLGVSARRVQDAIARMKGASKRGEAGDVGDSLPTSTIPAIQFPDLPDELPPVEEDIAALIRISDRKRAARRAKDWRTIRITGGGPVAVAFIGDPHMDNEGCNWSLLKRDVQLIKETPGLFCGNMGDSIDNWVGRLVRLKGTTSVTDQRAWRLVKWLMDELHPKLVFWLLGNHDTYNDGTHIFEALGQKLIRMDDWQARFVLEFDNGLRVPIWAAHHFKGTSQFNKLHGHEKADLWSRGAARLYLSGHQHEWAITEEECPERHITYWKAKARGYKHVDSYAENLQFFPQDSGATITAVFDPDATTEPGVVRLFPDMVEAVEFLTWKRARWAARKQRRF